MKSARGWLGLALALILLVQLAPAGHASGGTVKLNYANNDGRLTLKGADGATNLVIPAQVQDGNGQSYPVTEIASGAFEASPDLSRVVIPASVSYIGHGAFQSNPKLAQIEVDERNTSYSAQGGGLYDKQGATLLTFAQGISGEVKTPDALSLVDADAFLGCSNITSIRFNEGLSEIGANAFSGCGALKSVELPVSLEVLPQASVFASLPSLTKIAVASGSANYESKDGALYRKGGESLYAWPTGVVGKVSVAVGTTTIGEGAFRGAGGITGISLPDGLYSIEANAFAGCGALTELVIPDGTALIGRGAFDDCSALARIVIPASVIDIGDIRGVSAVIECERGSYAATFAEMHNLAIRYAGEPEVTIEQGDGGEEGEEPLPTPAPEDGQPSVTPDPAWGSGYQMLSALNDPLLTETYQYLREGNVIKKGTRSERVRGLQQLLNLLGDSLTVDGSIGEKTISALNAAQKGFALDPTDTVSQADYERLLECAYVALDPDAAEGLLGEDHQQQIDYVRACAAYQNGNYFSAEQLFTALGNYRDSQEHAKSCRQSWPKDGQIVRNGHTGQSVQLTIQTGREDNLATYIKVYTEEEQFVAGVFIAGTGSVTISLPGGSYIFKTGVGTSWYGPNEAFGRDNGSSYQRLTFEGGADVAQLKNNYAYTLSLTKKGNVGSAFEKPDDF